MKKYLNIREVSEILGIREHTIRYWDSINPKTKKLRVEGISTKSKGGTRYFNRENINKLQRLRDLIYENGVANPSVDIADKYLSKSKKSNKNTENQSNDYVGKNIKKIDQILKNMRNLLK